MLQAVITFFKSFCTIPIHENTADPITENSVQSINRKNSIVSVGTYGLGAIKS